MQNTKPTLHQEYIPDGITFAVSIGQSIVTSRFSAFTNFSPPEILLASTEDIGSEESAFNNESTKPARRASSFSTRLAGSSSTDSNSKGKHEKH